MKVITPFPHLTYDEAIERYGTDKPDIRFRLELRDLSDIVGDSGFGVFRSTVQSGGRVKAICLPGCAGYSGKQLDELTQLARTHGAKGLITLAVVSGGEDSPGHLTADNFKSVASKHLSLAQLREMASRAEAHAGDLMLVVAGEPKMVNKVLDELRREMGRRLNLIEPGLLAFVFVTGFPLFERNAATGHWESMHHPFTAPVEEDIPLIGTEPSRVRARHYDIVCNGYELSSGSIRIHNRELQQKVFRVLGYSAEETERRFGHLLEAFEFGAPPHGGIAPGIDRVVMLLAGCQNIREVIAFPKNQNAVDVMSDAPSAVSPEQLGELHLRLKDEALQDTG